MSQTILDPSTFLVPGREFLVSFRGHSFSGPGLDVERLVSTGQPPRFLVYLALPEALVRPERSSDEAVLEFTREGEWEMYAWQNSAIRGTEPDK